MPRKKRPAKASLLEEQEKRPNKAGTEYVLSPLLANAQLRPPLDEQVKLLRLEKLQMEVARQRAEHAGIDRSRSENEQQGAFSHSPDYRSVSLNGVTYSLTPRQAQIVEILHVAYKDGKPHVANDYVLTELGTKCSRWQDTFRTNREARKALITSGARKGTLRLNV